MNDAGIDANGQIQYKYNAEDPRLKGDTIYVWPPIVLTLDGVSRVTTSSQFQIGLDSVKLKKDLTAIMDRIEIPSVVEKPEDLTKLFKLRAEGGRRSCDDRLQQQCAAHHLGHADVGYR